MNYQEKLEELLNELIKKWRKPRWQELTKIEYDEIWPIFYWMEEDWNWGYCPSDNTLNDLCSIDSWLRQFVCWLDKDYLPFCSKCNIKLESNNDKIKWDVWYEEEVNFRLMLSSIQEDKKSFLLNNIKL